MMGMKRSPPTEAPRAYRYVMRFYGRKNLRPVVVAMSLITAIWALAWTVSSFKQLKLVKSYDLPKLAPSAIAQGVMFGIGCLFQTYGIIAAGMQRFTMIKINAFLCALSTLLIIATGLMRVITHFVFKSDFITECIGIAQTGSIGPVFGIWGSNPTNRLNKDQATDYCNSEWSRDSFAEIVALVLEILLGLFFTSIAFAYYRQALDPSSAANSYRVPFNPTRRDNHHTHYNPPYDGTSYVPVYLPSAGPPPADGKPPEYKRASDMLFRGDNDAKEDDSFSDYDGPSVPMPTHWVEDRDTTSPPRV